MGLLFHSLGLENEANGMKLFAVFLGGRALRCNTELHDVVFAIGERIEETYEQLMDLWFGTPKGLHIDSWLELNSVDGYAIKLSSAAPTSNKRLYFVNLGAYRPGEFTELHANAFIVATDEKEVKARAKSELLVGMSSVHTDDLYEVDDCIEVSAVGGYHIQLQPIADKTVLEPNNGYHIIPQPIVRSYLARFPERDPDGLKGF